MRERPTRQRRRGRHVNGDTPARMITARSVHASDGPGGMPRRPTTSAAGTSGRPPAGWPFPRSVGHVQPLVAVDAPRVGELHAVGQAAAIGAGRAHASKAPSTCGPPTAGVDGGGDQPTASNAHVLTSPAWAHTIRGPSTSASTASSSSGPHPAHVVGRHDDRRRRAEAEEAQGAVDRAVAVLADDHGHGGRARSGRGPRRPTATAGQHPVAGGGEARPVGHLGAGDDADARLPG